MNGVKALNDFGGRKAAMIITYQIFFYGAIVFGAGGAATLALRLWFAKRPVLWDLGAAWAVVLGMFLGLLAALAWNDPALYVYPVGSPEALSVTHLAYLNGSFGETKRLRVDTTTGVYFVGAVAPLPRHGTVYLITRRRKWGNATREFLCLDRAQKQCWPERKPDP